MNIDINQTDTDTLLFSLNVFQREDGEVISGLTTKNSIGSEVLFVAMTTFVSFLFRIGLRDKDIKAIFKYAMLNKTRKAISNSPELMMPEDFS